MKIKKAVIVFIVLIIWAVFSVAYIGWDSWQKFKTVQMQQALNQGLSQGYQQAILGIAQAAQKCEAVPLNLGQDANGKTVTMNIVDVACLQQKGEANEPAATGEEKK